MYAVTDVSSFSVKNVPCSCVPARIDAAPAGGRRTATMRSGPGEAPRDAECGSAR